MVGLVHHVIGLTLITVILSWDRTALAAVLPLCSPTPDDSSNDQFGIYLYAYKLKLGIEYFFAIAAIFPMR